MQIIVPMSGFGERFRRKGYSVPKPLIEIEGKPIIAHVIEMFPGEHDFIFVCNNEHLAASVYDMRGVLNELCPSGKIVGIEPHKLGPINAVLKALEHIDLTLPTIVNYCDFTCYWDWLDFKNFVEESKCDGAIPAYRGFHPHTLGSTNYAYLREDDLWVSAIQEKQPFTDNRMDEFASSGTYYFANGQMMVDAFSDVVARDINVGGEFYVSLAYIPLLEQKKNIAVYELQHFMQWGTPEDVAEYNTWSNAFRRLARPESAQLQKPKGAMIVPMAGLGKRFRDEGYATTKPLIEVSGKPMVVQACDALPLAEHHVFILREDMPGADAVSGLLSSTFSNVSLVSVPSVTEGQACSAKLGVDELPHDYPDLITFGACDFAALYDAQKLMQLFQDESVDVLVWGVRGHAGAIRQPTMYGWIDASADGSITQVSVKKPLHEDPSQDAIVLGSFTFRTVEIFNRCYQSLLNRGGKINGEYYLDSCITDALALGLNCKLFEVDSYISWGTPNELKTFEYWQSCFSKWDVHPYKIDVDPRIPSTKRSELNERFAKKLPMRPRSLAC